MPGDLPVRGRRFVEEEGTDGAGVGAENRIDQLPEGERPGQGADGGNPVEKVADAAAAGPLPGSRRVLNGLYKSVNRGGGEDTGENCEAGGQRRRQSPV